MSTLIDVAHPLPAKLVYEDMPILFQDSKEATTLVD
jgi:hypothetical protein